MNQWDLFPKRIMEKTKLSISLIKEGIPLTGVVKANTPQMGQPHGKILYYQNNQPAKPKWLNIMKQYIMNKLVRKIQVNIF